MPGPDPASSRRSTRPQEAEALADLETMPGFYVVKTNGLAAGKGVLVTESLTEVCEGVREYLSGAAFGDAGRKPRHRRRSDRAGAHAPRAMISLK